MKTSHMRQLHKFQSKNNNKLSSDLMLAFIFFVHKSATQFAHKSNETEKKINILDKLNVTSKDEKKKAIQRIHIQLIMLYLSKKILQMPKNTIQKAISI